ncbi:MAG: hypothetical protein ACO36I_19370, partial [Candidatus Latescibacterota bacterium]
TTVEEGLNFTAPRLQILLRSPLMIEETSGMRQTIGTFENEDVKYLRLAFGYASLKEIQEGIPKLAECVMSAQTAL